MMIKEKDVKNIVAEYRTKKIDGQCIDLIPVCKSDLNEIIRLRNQAKSKYYFNQKKDITLAEQKVWFEEYLLREDDLYWCIRNKDGIIVGLVRLYSINEESCIHGSFVIDEAYAGRSLYALEAEILSLGFAFDVLNVNEIINEDRIDNHVMNSISRKMGFLFTSMIEINGADYCRYRMTRDTSKVGQYKQILNDFFSSR